MIYLAVDPGKATGLAYLQTPPVPKRGRDIDVEPTFGSRILEGPRLEHADFVEQMVNNHKGDIIVIIESWQVRKNTHQLSAQDDPRYLLGAIEHMCHRYNVAYHEQTAAQMKSFCNHPKEYAKQRQLGWHKPGEGHDNDAAGHLLTHLVKQSGIAGDYVRNQLT